MCAISNHETAWDLRAVLALCLTMSDSPKIMKPGQKLVLVEPSVEPTTLHFSHVDNNLPPARTHVRHKSSQRESGKGETGHDRPRTA